MDGADGLHKEADAYTDPPRIVFAPTLGIFERGFLPYLGNSAFVTILSTLIVLLLGVPAAYTLSLAPVPKTSNVLGFSCPRRCCGSWPRSSRCT